MFDCPHIIYKGHYYSCVPPSRLAAGHAGGMRKTFSCLSKLGGTTNFMNFSYFFRVK